MAGVGGNQLELLDRHYDDQRLAALLNFVLKLAAALKADPRAVMDVPAVRVLYARVAGAGPALEQDLACYFSSLHVPITLGWRRAGVRDARLFFVRVARRGG